MAKTVKKKGCVECAHYVYKTKGFKCRKMASDKYLDNVKKCREFRKGD